LNWNGEWFVSHVHMCIQEGQGRKDWKDYVDRWDLFLKWVTGGFSILDGLGFKLYQIGGAADIFVTELADQVREVSSTPQSISLLFLYLFSFILMLSASKTKSGASVVALSLPIEGPSR